jgi:hypothetical protein
VHRPSFPALVGSTLVAIGGDHDTSIFDRYQDASFTIEWVPGWNVRRIQAAAESIKLGRTDGVIFLADANRHASFDAVRAACKSSNTPLVFGSMGVTALLRALQSLNDLKAGA